MSANLQYFIIIPIILSAEHLKWSCFSAEVMLFFPLIYLGHYYMVLILFKNILNSVYHKQGGGLI